MMESSLIEASLLETTAEVSVSFMGFVGIFLVLAARDGRFAGDDYLMIKVLVFLSVSSVFFSPIPIVLVSLGVPESSVWQVSSGSVGIIGLAIALYMIRDTRKVYQRGDQVYELTSRDILMASLGVTYFVTVFGNSFAWPWTPSGGVYLVTVWTCLGLAATTFVDLIFRKVL